MNILEKYIEILTNCSLFKGIAPEEIINLLKNMDTKILSYNSGNIIFSSTENFSNIGIVLSGSIEISKETASGDKIIMNKFNKGNVFGEVFALSSRTTPNIFVTSLEKTTILFLNAKSILLIQPDNYINQSKIISNIVQELANKALFLNSKIDYLTIKSMRGKLSTYLYNRYIGLSSTSFSIPYNRNELADFLNVSRPSMSRELGKMRNQGVISFKGSNFKLLDIREIIKYVE